MNAHDLLPGRGARLFITVEAGDIRQIPRAPAAGQRLNGVLHARKPERHFDQRAIGFPRLVVQIPEGHPLILTILRDNLGNEARHLLAVFFPLSRAVKYPCALVRPSAIVYARPEVDDKRILVLLQRPARNHAGIGLQREHDGKAHALTDLQEAVQPRNHQLAPGLPLTLGDKNPQAVEACLLRIFQLLADAGFIEMMPHFDIAVAIGRNKVHALDHAETLHVRLGPFDTPSAIDKFFPFHSPFLL